MAKNRQKIEKIKMRTMKLASLSFNFKNLMPYNHQFVRHRFV